MEKFIIEGGFPLHGEITPGGNKNAALPLMAACLLTSEPIILRNVPDIQDVQTMRQLFMSLGVEFHKIDDRVWKIQAKNALHLPTLIQKFVDAFVLLSFLLDQ